MLTEFDWVSVICAVLSAICMARPLFSRPPRFPTHEFTNDLVIGRMQGEINARVQNAWEKLNEEIERSWKEGKYWTSLGLTFLLLSLAFQLAASAIR